MSVCKKNGESKTNYRKDIGYCSKLYQKFLIKHMWIHCLVLISLKTSSAINWQTRIMLHSQARVIVLIMLPEMCLIKKKNAVFPEVLLQYLGGIRTEFIGINQTNCFTQKLLTSLRTPSALPTRTTGLPLDVCISFSKAVSAIFPFHLEYPYLSLKKQHQPLLILHCGEKVLRDGGICGYLCELLFGGKLVSVNLHGKKNAAEPRYYQKWKC